MKTVFKNCILLDGTKNMAPIEHTEAVQYNSNIVYNNMIAGSKTALANGITVGFGILTLFFPFVCSLIMGFSSNRFAVVEW